MLTFLSATPTVICDQLYKIIRDACRAKKISFDGKPLSLLMLPTYHHMHIARHIVDFDDPVHRFSAFEQQDNVTMYPGTFLQWPQINYDIHLESTTGKKERERINNNRWSGLRNVTVPLSGQLIKKLEVFPEKTERRRMHYITDNTVARYGTQDTTHSQIFCLLGVQNNHSTGE